mgnify:CR=1 FL=1
MRKFKRFITVVSFQIGVNVIGLPIFWQNFFYADYQYEIPTNSKFIR